MENGIIKLNLVLYLPNINVMLTWIDKQKGRCARVDCFAFRTQKKIKYVHGVQTQIFPNQMAKIRNKVFLTLTWWSQNIFQAKTNWFFLHKSKLATFWLCQPWIRNAPYKSYDHLSRRILVLDTLYLWRC